MQADEHAHHAIGVDFNYPEECWFEPLGPIPVAAIPRTGPSQQYRGAAGQDPDGRSRNR